MAEKPSKKDVVEGLVARVTGLEAARQLRIPPVNAENLPQVAGLMGSCAATIMVMLRNEAGRNKFQRWIGATPLRQASEETAVKASALAASTSVAVIVAATMEGARRYQARATQQTQFRNFRRRRCRGPCPGTAVDTSAKPGARRPRRMRQRRRESSPAKAHRDSCEHPATRPRRDPQ